LAANGDFAQNVVPMDAKAPRQARLWRFCDAVFDELALTLRVGDSPIEVERRPLELLSLLLEHAGEVVTKDEILYALWPNKDVSDGSLTTCLGRLRNAIGDDDHTIIRTAHGFGYRFAVPVSVQQVEARAIILPPEVDLAAGDRIFERPGWTLVRKLGSGGFGDAWLGEFRTTNEKRVFKFAARETGLVALRREVALGRLLSEGLGPREDLNHIVGWNFDAPPYFTEMAYWPLGNLAEWCSAQVSIGALSMELRLELVAQIADALAAAHTMSVLHKDIKPANVLIRTDEFDCPAIVLTDFGSGRALDQSRFAHFGITGFDAPTGPEGASGTAMYLAPELIAGGIPTIKADIYALGVLLFQIITGDFRRPLAPGWEELVDDALLRSDIAAAAAGDPDKRLSDASDLASRLRQLDLRRIAALREADAQKELERALAALSRARARRTPILALIAALAVGFSVSSWMYIRAEDSASQARAVTHFLTDDLLSSANPLLAGNPEIKVKEVLATASANLDRRFPNGGLDRAAIEAALGGVYAGLADSKNAEALLQAALLRRRAALGDSAPETQAIRIALADLYERDVNNAGLARMGHQILASDPRDLATLLHGRFAAQLADCASNETGTACINSLRDTLVKARTELGPRDAFTLRVQSMLAFHLANNERVAEAIPLARQAVMLSAQIYGANHPLVQERRYQLAEVLIHTNHLSEATAILLDVRRHLLQISGHETELTMRAANQLGYAYNNLKQYDEALRYLRQALDYNIAVRGEGFELSREGYNNVAEVLSAMDRGADAIAAGQKALALERKASGIDNPDSLWFENNLAMYYRQAGNLHEAANIWSDVVRRARGQFTHGEWDLAHFLYRAGETETMIGDNTRACTDLSESMRRFTAALGARNDRTLKAKIAMAQFCRPAPQAVAASKK
jgi:eukaryotic-like serine/threonine-protein kinase